MDKNEPNKSLKLKKFSQSIEKVYWKWDSSVLRIIFIYPNSLNNQGLNQRENYYWRLGDISGKNLLSTNIDKQTGQLNMLEMLLYNGYLQTLLESEKKLGESNDKVPFFDLEPWETAQNLEQKHPLDSLFFDVSGKFILQINKTSIRIEIISSQIEYWCVVDNKVVFEFNIKDELCALTLKNFIGQDREKLFSEWEKGP